MMKRLTVAAFAAMLLPTLGIADAAPAQTEIQPGARVSSSAGSCTLNFVFQGSSATFIGTAGHCAKDGERMRTHSGKEFGTVVWRENQSAPGIDFALIRVDSNFVSQVQPSVRTFGGPLGFTNASETNTGDLLFVTGYGLGFGSLAVTRDRGGILLSDDANEYRADLVAVQGDSGGPLVHVRTGKALGVISRFNLPFSTDIGPTMDAILRRLRGSGFPNLELVTAPLN
jgi:hypothetical protein